MKALRIQANTMSLIVQFTAVQSHVLQNNPAVSGKAAEGFPAPASTIRPSRSWRRGRSHSWARKIPNGNGGQEQGQEPGAGFPASRRGPRRQTRRTKWRSSTRK